MEDRRTGLWAAVAAGTLLVVVSSSLSCIIPDKGIVAWVDCGARWCATAEFAQALDEANNPAPVQEGHPDGTAGWVTECVCMTPEQDIILLAGAPVIQYDLLRTEIINATRQRCLDVAIANGLDPDPPFPLGDTLDPNCADAAGGIFRDGCCTMRSDECGGVNTCELGGTGGGPTGDTDPTGAESADGSSGEMSSLEPMYDLIECSGTTCRIGQPLIEAVLHEPEAVLAEGTSLRLSTREDGVTGLELQGVEPEGLAWRLGLREGDLVLAVDELPLREESELWAAAAQAYEAESVTLTLRRGETTLERRLVRVR